VQAFLRSFNKTRRVFYWPLNTHDLKPSERQAFTGLHTQAFEGF